jgi:hypothetical protein
MLTYKLQAPLLTWSDLSPSSSQAVVAVEMVAVYGTER